MMHLRRIAPVAWATVSLFIITEFAFAQGKSEEAKARHFGIGHPKAVAELPSGKFKNQLEKLPAKARGKALGSLQGFSFPSEDLEHLQVSSEGSIWYADSFEADESSHTNSENVVIPTDLSEAEIFSLHSKPGSGNVVFLDFDGAHIEGTTWNSTGLPLDPLPFDPSENDDPPTVANFTQDELSRIFEIWHRVSEDYAQFDIDVTTEEPVVFTSTTGHVIFTHFRDANYRLMPGYSAGGIARINVFGTEDYATESSPAFVYYTNLSVDSHGDPTYNAEVASHEFGHNLGLSHDGTSSASYYRGHGTGLVSWAPIMGRGQDNNVTTWSKGDYPGANNTQDDIAIITEKLGHAGDDHGDSAALATALSVEANGDILVSSPELDPDNVLPDNKGVIDSRHDTDWFYIDVTDDTTLSISATPAWHSFTRSSNRGANLDIDLTLLDSDMALVAFSEPTDDTNAAVTASLAAGRYYIVVEGVGNNSLSDYSDYASMGLYFIEGNIDGEIAQPDLDSTPPSPTEMSWQSAPTATGQTSMAMTAVEASDESGTVEYYFSCVTGGNGCIDSGWQSSRSYSAHSLDPNTYYAFKVKARDSFGNENNASSTSGDTTDAPPSNQAPTAIAAYVSESAIISKGKSASVELTGTDSFDPDGSIAFWKWTDASGTQVGSTSTITVKLREGTHSFTLTVTDNKGATGSSTVEVSVNKPGGDEPKGKPPKK